MVAMKRRAAKIVKVAMAAAAVLALAGCWPFGARKPTPQQQFLDAIKHGQSAQASQIWLHMSGEDRLKWSRGQGITPEVSRDELQNRINHHYERELNGAGDNGASSEPLTPDINGGSLQDLPAAAGQPPQPTN
jgi:hypothetical protein